MQRSMQPVESSQMQLQPCDRRVGPDGAVVCPRHAQVPAQMCAEMWGRVPAQTRPQSIGEGRAHMEPSQKCATRKFLRTSQWTRTTCGPHLRRDSSARGSLPPLLLHNMAQ